MDDLRATKLIAVTILTATGALCLALGGPQGVLPLLVGLALLTAGVPLLVIQWRGPGRYEPPPKEPADRTIDTGIREARERPS